MHQGYHEIVAVLLSAGAKEKADKKNVYPSAIAQVIYRLGLNCSLKSIALMSLCTRSVLVLLILQSVLSGCVVLDT